MARPHRPHLDAVMREGERVLPLELFFDLVFVLALTQCTAYLAEHTTWTGLAQALLILGMLWWSWVGYSWLTSVINPEEGAVRIAIFVAMAGFLISSLCIPEAFDDLGLLFACAYAVVRIAHIALFAIASREDAALRRSVIGLAVSTAIGTSLLVVASFTDDGLQIGIWALALFLDAGGPYVYGADGWKIQPGHFAERHALIIIIALGESIVAIGAGASATVDTGVVVAAILGIAVAAAFWWMYFDVVALVAERRLQNAEPGREQNEIARDSFSYLHFPMVAGIVLVALGMKKTLGHVEDPLKLIPAVGMLGGSAVYLFAHVAFRWRNVHRFSPHRLATGVLLLALIPVGVEVDSIVTLATLAAILIALIVYEYVRFAELRKDLRARLHSDAVHE
ncbi:MAG TPA: low temperature requirement protein A [Baekduia sp.]|nr:low temperature requirement protein A [Baekduia sp.]